MATLRKMWDAIRGVDPRRMQFEIDMHRLFLLTSYQRQRSENLDTISELGNTLPLEEQQRSVQENVQEQILRIGEALDGILLAEPQRKSPPQESQKRPSGLSFAVGHQSAECKDHGTAVSVKTHPLTLAEVSMAVRTGIGFTLDLRPSQVDHEDAGKGVFIVGEAEPGRVVAFYPGVVYSPPQYRYMRGYPKMDAVNSYLVSRYDGLIIDGQPWGCGGETREMWDGFNAAVDPERSTDATPVPEGFEQKNNRLWGSIFGAKEASGARKGSILERRNPLALAHYINHPRRGGHANVMLCPYDHTFPNSNLRPYIPNVHFDEDDDWEVRRRGLIWTYDKRGDRIIASPAVRTVVLVATKKVCNEELFLNYRLSNHKKWPSWYTPIDSEEDKRRWH